MMKIEFPNRLRTRTRSVRASGPEGLTKDLLDHCPGIPGVTRAEGPIVVSVTEATSEFAPGIVESFRETIVKVPVFYSGLRYLLPARAWVDSERSIVRGAILGFNKLFRASSAWSDMRFEIDSGININLNHVILGAAHHDELPDEQKRLLLLSPGLVVPTLGIEAAGPSRLTVEGYRYTAPSQIAGDAGLWSGLVLGYEIRGLDIWEVFDDFILTGSKPLS